MQRRYWYGSSNEVYVDDNEADRPDYGDRAAFFEPTVSGRKVGIKIRNLTKVSSHNIWLCIASLKINLLPNPLQVINYQQN